MAQRDVRQFQVGAGRTALGGRPDRSGRGALAAPHCMLAAHTTCYKTLSSCGAIVPGGVVSGMAERGLSPASTSFQLPLCSLVLGNHTSSLSEALFPLCKLSP